MFNNEKNLMVKESSVILQTNSYTERMFALVLKLSV